MSDAVASQYARPGPELGFRERVWENLTAPALEWFRRRVAAAESAGSLPPLGLHLLLGKDFQAMFRNQVRNMAEGPDRRDPGGARAALTALPVRPGTSARHRRPGAPGR